MATCDLLASCSMELLALHSYVCAGGKEAKSDSAGRCAAAQAVAVVAAPAAVAEARHEAAQATTSA